LPLSEIKLEKEQQEWMYEAYTEHGYTMQNIAMYAGLHHSTISKKIKRARIKTLLSLQHNIATKCRIARLDPIFPATFGHSHSPRNQ